MVDDDAFAVARVARDPIGRLGPRVIVFGVGEIDLPGPEGFGLSGGEVVGHDRPVLPIEEVGAARMDAKDVAADELSLGDERPLARGCVDPVVVPGRKDRLVAQVGPPVETDGPYAVLSDVEVAHRLVGELDELPRRHVEGGSEGEVPVPPGLDHLDRLDTIVGRVPDVHVGRFVRGLAARIGGWNLLFDPEENALAVFAPIEVGPVAGDPAFRKAFGLGRIEDGRRRGGLALLQTSRDVREGDENIVLLAHLFDLGPLEDRQGRARVVPGEAVVVLRVVVQRPHPAVPGVEDEEAVAVLDRRVDREGEEFPALVEGEVGHASEKLEAAGLKVEQDGVPASRA